MDILLQRLSQMYACVTYAKFHVWNLITICKLWYFSIRHLLTLHQRSDEVIPQFMDLLSHPYCLNTHAHFLWSYAYCITNTKNKWHQHLQQLKILFFLIRDLILSWQIYIPLFQPIVHSRYNWIRKHKLNHCAVWSEWS